MTTETSDANDPATVVHTSKTIHRTRSFSFVVEEVTLPNGVRTEMAMVRHPGSTAVVPISNEGRIVMLRQYRYVVGRYLLEIPAGTMEPGETPLHCAQRELEEETGLLAGQWVDLGRIHMLPAYTDERIHVYLAHDFSKSRPNLDENEIIDVVEYPYAELMAMIDTGHITDALTILSLQWAGNRLESLGYSVP